MEFSHDSKYPLVTQRIHRRVERRRSENVAAEGSEMKQHLLAGNNGKSVLSGSLRRREPAGVTATTASASRAPNYREKMLPDERLYDEVFEQTAGGNGHPVLTRKELQLLELLSYGYENGDIADHFKTSLQAVKNMLRTANLKLGADNRTHAVAICFRNGWLPLKATKLEA